MALATLTTTLLPCLHGFSTRQGGVSQGPFSSLNLGGSVGDSVEAVQENTRRLARSAGITPERFGSAKQVHGTHVAQVVELAGKAVVVDAPGGEADALWTETPGLAVGVRTADCVPLLLVDPRGRRVAAVHSGWRGTFGRIAAQAVDALASAGSLPEDLLAVVGPCIQPCCYEVSAELADQFSGAFGESARELREGRWFLKLGDLVVRTLVERGLPAAQVERMPACTACDAERFYSHRRDGGATGRHFSFVVCPA